MTTDNRTNEPTPEQVEAAAKALREMRDFDEGVSSLLLGSWSRMVATTALEAAAGAAPQAERERQFCGPCRRGQHGCCDKGEFLPCDCFHKSAVQPSSTVDVDKLAEVIASDPGLDAVFHHQALRTMIAPRIARAVAEWLGGEGRGESN